MPDTDDTSGSSGADPANPEAAQQDAGAEPAQPENRRARRAAAATSRRKGAPPVDRDRRRPVESGLDAGERVDDALARAADGTVRFLKRNFNYVQWLIVASAAGWIGWQIYSYRSDKASVRSGELLAEAVAAAQGRVGEPEDQGQRDSRGSLDARRIFKTPEERQEAARQGYEKVSAERPGTPAASLARLGLAGVLYDQGKFDEARQLFDEVAGSELAKLDPESRGRALEGSGLALEAKGDKDAALKRFGELENTDIAGFRELALYHQARLLNAKGDRDGAKERLKKVVEKLSKESSATEGPSYLLGSARELLQRIDPTAVPKESDDEAIRRALEEFKSKLPAGVTQVPTPPAP